MPAVPAWRSQAKLLPPATHDSTRSSLRSDGCPRPACSRHATAATDPASMPSRSRPRSRTTTNYSTAVAPCPVPRDTPQAAAERRRVWIPSRLMKRPDAAFHSSNAESHVPASARCTAIALTANVGGAELTAVHAYLWFFVMPAVRLGRGGGRMETLWKPRRTARASIAAALGPGRSSADRCHRRPNARRRAARRLPGREARHGRLLWARRFAQRRVRLRRAAPGALHGAAGA